MANMTRGLGRGLDALLGGLEVDTSHPEVMMISIGSISANPHQPRKEFDPEALQDLCNSIKTQGVLQPILVRPSKEKKGELFELVAGERRLRASKLAGLAEIPALVKDMSDDDSLAVALIENLQREDLNPIEEALGMQELIHKLSLSQEELSKRVGKSRSAVANTLRLLQLPEAVQQDIVSSKLTAGHARALMSVQDEQYQDELRVRILEYGLSVRQAEDQASFWKKAGELPSADQYAQQAGLKKKRVSVAPQTLPKFVEIEEDLLSQYEAKIKISGSYEKPRVSMTFADAEEFERVISILKQNG